ALFKPVARWNIDNQSLEVNRIDPNGLAGAVFEWRVEPKFLNLDERLTYRWGLLVRRFQSPFSFHGLPYAEPFAVGRKAILHRNMEAVELHMGMKVIFKSLDDP